jgi:hypothetical protein
VSVFGTHIADAVTFFSEPGKRHRRAAPTITNGRMVAEGAESSIDVLICIQPASQRDLEQAPAGTIEPGDSVVFCNTEIRLADEVELDSEGVRWHVQHVTHTPAA